MADLEKKKSSEAAEAERLAKIDKLDSNQKRKKLIFAGVTLFLVSLFVFGTVFGGKYILSYEGTQEMPEEETEYAELPAENDSEKIRALLNELLDGIKDKNAVKLSKSAYFSLDRDDITVISGFEGSEAYIDIIKDYVSDTIGSYYSDIAYEEGFGNDFSSYLPDISFIENAKSSCTVDEENPANATLCFTAGTEAENLFVPDNADEIKQDIVSKLSSMADIKDASLSYESFNVYYYKEENLLTCIKTERVLSGTLTLSFTGVYSDFGDVTLSFTARLGENLSCTRVSFNILSDVYRVEKGDSDEIKHSVTSDESPADVVITWTSSDESVLSIDGNFYKAHKVSDTPVTVTGTYTYLGKEYTDTCLIYVRVPVESIKLDKKNIVLEKVGDTAELTPTVKPKAATFKDVCWFTTDENIVTVDENGVVTAVGEGTASVYAITVDGNYKKSCTVTVGTE